MAGGARLGYPQRMHTAVNGSAVPFPAAAPLSSHPSPTPASRVPAAAPAGLMETVLVVDDEADARDVLATLLESWNVLVSTASSAQEALEKVIKERPDIVISDIGMPAEDGCQLLRNIRRLPPAEGGRTPAIALTAYARAEERSKSLVAGFNLHLAKPVEPAELLDALASLAPILEARR